MDNIKLNGLKQIRENNNISIEKLASDINLINNSGVDFVVTPEYLQKLESRKQKTISDNLLKILINYFNVTLDELLNKQNNNKQQVSPGMKIIALKYNIITNGDIVRLKYTLEINENISEDCITFIVDLVLRRFGIIRTKDEFAEYIQIVDNVFEQYNSYLKLHNNKTLPKYEEQIFIQDSLNELEYGEQLNIMRIMGCAYKYFKEDLKLTDRDAQTLATAFVDVMLHNGEL